MSKGEVTSREWLMADGTRATLINFDVHRTNDGEAVAVAKYGSKRTGRVSCVDIYECDAGSQGAIPRLFLLCHDTRPGWLTLLEVECKKAKVLFHFTRESPVAQAGGAVRNNYSYAYDRRSGFRETPADFYWKANSASNQTQDPPTR
jgi:hypothetical protein